MFFFYKCQNKITTPLIEKKMCIALKKGYSRGFRYLTSKLSIINSMHKKKINRTSKHLFKDTNYGKKCNE